MAKYFTKEILNNFIAKSAKEFKTSNATYLENVAKKCYVVMQNGKPVTYDNSIDEENPAGRIMILRNEADAYAEAKEIPNAKVMTEYDMYVAKGVFSNAA